MQVSRQEEDLRTDRRANQKQRTRRALIEAAERLVRDGRSPSVAEVADEALVSRATAYRYFPSQRALFLEVSADRRVPTFDEVFGAIAPDDVLGRVDAMVRIVGGRMFDDELLYRNIVRASLERWFEQQGTEEGSLPVREGRRLQWIDEALRPLRTRLTRARLAKLRDALALVWGPEALIVTRDVCQIEADAAVETTCTAARYLVVGALAEAKRR